MLIVKTYLKERDKKGIALMAGEAILQDQHVWIDDPFFRKTVSLDEFNALADMQQHFIKTYATFIEDDGCYYLDLDDTRFINHSFKPNILFRDDDAIALHDIAKDEEITCDYLVLSAANRFIDFSTFAE